MLKGKWAAGHTPHYAAGNRTVSTASGKDSEKGADRSQRRTEDTTKRPPCHLGVESGCRLTFSVCFWMNVMHFTLF